MNKKLWGVILSLVVFALSIFLFGGFTVSARHVKSSIGGHMWIVYVSGKMAAFHDGTPDSVTIDGKRYEGWHYDTPYGTLYDMYFYSEDNKTTGNLMILLGDVTYSYVWNIYQFDEDKHSYVPIFSDSYGNGVYKAMSYLASANMYASQSTSQVSLGGNYKLLTNSQGHFLSPHGYSADDVYGPIKKYSVVFPYINASISSCKGEKNIGFSGGIKVLPFVNIRSSQEEYKVVGIGLFIRDDMTQALMSEYASAYGVSYLSPQLVGFSSMNLHFGIYKDTLLDFTGWVKAGDSERFINPSHFRWISAFSGAEDDGKISGSATVYNLRKEKSYVYWQAEDSTGEMQLQTYGLLPILLSHSGNIDKSLWYNLNYIPDTSFVPIYATYDMGKEENHVAQIHGTLWLHVASKIYWQGSGHSACTTVISAPIYVNMRFRAVD